MLRSTLVIFLGLATAVGAQDWETKLEVTQGGVAGFYPAIGAREGAVALLHRGGTTNDSTRPYFSSLFRARENGVWSNPIEVDAGLPTYASSYGTHVTFTFQHYARPLPQGWILGVSGRYSGTYLTSEGNLYALFLRTVTGPWVRVTPVGRVYNPAIDTDAEGRVWFAWTSADNLNAGEIRFSSFDPGTGTIGPVEIVDAASMQTSWQSVDVLVAGGSVWVTYRAPDGLFARRRNSNGTWDARIPVISSDGYGHDAVFSDGTVWVATNEPGVRVYRLTDGIFVGGPAIFPEYYFEDATKVEQINYYSPSIAARPEGGIAVTATRAYHYENFVAPYGDGDEHSFVARERDSAGAWSAEQTIVADVAYQVPNVSCHSSPDGIWFAGGNDLDPELRVLLRPAGSDGDTGAPLPNIEQMILEFVNDPSTTHAQLVQAIQLGYANVPGFGPYTASKVADSIVANRPFATLKDLYQKTSAGTEAMEGLEIYVGQQYYSLVGPSAILQTVNDPTRLESFFKSLGLGSDSAKWLVRYRDGGPDLHLQQSDDNAYAPFPRVFGTGSYSDYQDYSKRYPAYSVDEVPEIGPDALQKLFDWAMAN